MVWDQSTTATVINAVVGGLVTAAGAGVIKAGKELKNFFNEIEEGRVRVSKLEKTVDEHDAALYKAGWLRAPLHERRKHER